MGRMKRMEKDGKDEEKRMKRMERMRERKRMKRREKDGKDEGGAAGATFTSRLRHWNGSIVRLGLTPLMSTCEVYGKFDCRIGCK